MAVNGMKRLPEDVWEDQCPDPIWTEGEKNRTSRKSLELYGWWAGSGSNRRRDFSGGL
jgi:hypothetical protein